MLSCFASGLKLVMMYKWDADEAVDMIEREHVTAFSGVPTTAFQLLERAAERGVSLASLEGLSSGATLVPPELVRRVDQQFASRVAPGNGYGLTETSGAMLGNFGADYVARSDSVGKALTPGKHTLVFDFKYDGPGPAKDGTGVLSVDGKELDRKAIEHTIPLVVTN